MCLLAIKEKAEDLPTRFEHPADSERVEHWNCASGFSGKAVAYTQHRKNKPDQTMQVFVGLGNPGQKYAGNRHNIGFMALDRIAADHGFGPWRSKFQGHISEGRLSGEKVLLLKPDTFMNLSGQAVGEAMRFYKLNPSDITVFHDELDLAPGKLRVKTGGGHAGHNGLRSLHGHIGEAYKRVRMGIGHPGRKDLVSHYVLHDFGKADQDWLEAVLSGVSKGADKLAEGDAGKFLNAVSLQIKPPRSGTTKARKENPAPPPVAEPEDARSAMQRLLDRFR